MSDHSEVEALAQRLATINAELAVPTTSLYFGDGLRAERDEIVRKLGEIGREEAA